MDRTEHSRNPADVASALRGQVERSGAFVATVSGLLAEFGEPEVTREARLRVYMALTKASLETRPMLAAVGLRGGSRVTLAFSPPTRTAVWTGETDNVAPRRFGDAEQAHTLGHGVAWNPHEGIDLEVRLSHELVASTESQGVEWEMRKLGWQVQDSSTFVMWKLPLWALPLMIVLAGPIGGILRMFFSSNFSRRFKRKFQISITREQRGAETVLRLRGTATRHQAKRLIRHFQCLEQASRSDTTQ